MPLRFPGASARPPDLRDRHEAGDPIVLDYPWARQPNGCSVAPVGRLFSEFSPVCDRHDKCYYEFRTNSFDRATLSRQAWSSCNQNFTADLSKTCNPFFLKKREKIKTVKDFLGAVVDVFTTVLVKTATSTLCVNSAWSVAAAVDASAVLPDGVPPCTKGGCYTEAQRRQLTYQEWLGTVVQPPHCTVSGTADRITLKIDSWDQEYGVNDEPYFRLVSGLSAPGVMLTKKGYNLWEGKIDRLGEFVFEVENNFTGATSRCGVVISELPPELLPFGHIDVAAAIDRCPTNYYQVPGDLNEGAEGEFIFFCGRTGKTFKMVTDVTIVGAPHSSIECPAGYIKDPLDLNYGSGGWYIYLCKKLESVLDGTTKPITGLHVYSSRSAGNQCPADYEWIDFDLNKGAEGKFIYLCKK